MFSLRVQRTPYQGRYYIGAWTALGLESCEAPGARCGSTYPSNGVAEDRHASYEFFAWRIAVKTRYLDMGQRGATIIPSLETERMWARPVLLAVNLTEVVASLRFWKCSVARRIACSKSACSKSFMSAASLSLPVAGVSQSGEQAEVES